MAKKSINKIFLFPLSLIVIFFSSLIIIFSPVGKKNIIKVTVAPVEWQTYTNNQYGFEFQYPNNWHIFNREDNSVLSISNKPIDNNTSIEEPSVGQIFINFYSFHSAFENGLGVTEFKLDDGVPIISDTKYIADSNSFGMVVVYRKLDDASTIKTAQSTADQILSTFKFIK